MEDRMIYSVYMLKSDKDRFKKLLKSAKLIRKLEERKVPSMTIIMDLAELGLSVYTNVDINTRYAELKKELDKQRKSD